MRRLRRALSGFLCVLLIFTQLISGAFAIEKNAAMPLAEIGIQDSAEGEGAVSSVEEPGEAVNDREGEEPAEKEKPGDGSETVEPALPEKLEEIEEPKVPKEGSEAGGNEKTGEEEELDDDGKPDYNTIEFNTIDDNLTTADKVYAYVYTDHIDWYLKNKNADKLYQIGSAEELRGLAELVNGTAKDEKDEPIKAVDFEGDTITLENDLSLDDQEWTHIGNAGKPFKGTFDGNGYIIKGLKIEKTAEYAGLFGNITGTVKNLGVIGNIKSAGDNKGGIAGYSGGVIENCFYYDFGFTGLAGGDGAIKNSYYLAQANIEDDAAAKTMEEFKSGEVAYLLGNFGQALGIDGHPVSNGEKVHKITFTTEVENLIIEPTFMYINSTLPEMPNLTGEAAEDLPEGLDYVPLTDSEIIITNQTDISSDLELRIVRGFYPNSDGIFEISSKEKLKAFSWLVRQGLGDADAVITKDIKIQDIKTGDGEVLEAWSPIGTKEMPYEGYFDGKNFTISGLWMNGDEEYSGLFGYVKGGYIYNLVVDGYINSTGQYTGGIAAYAESAQITKCENNVLIKGGRYAGGIAGAIDENSGLQYCYGLKPVTVSGSEEGAGHAGSIIGENNGQGNSCFYYNPEDIGNSSLVGAGTPLVNSYYLVADDYSGEDPSAKTTVQFDSGEVAHLLGNSEFGQYLGYEVRPYFLERTIGVYKVTFNYLGKNEEVKKILDGYHFYVNQNMKIELPELPPLEGDKQYLFTTSDGESVTPETRINKDTTINVLEGIPAENELVEIKTAADLQTFRDMVNAGMTTLYGVLMDDISLEGIEWTPIGLDKSAAYAGVFNGNGYTISGLSIGTAENPVTTRYQGLFGYCERKQGSFNYYPIIHDLMVIGDVYGQDYVGGIVGCGKYTTLRNCTFGSKEVPGRVTATGSYAGGLAGELSSGNLEGTMINYADITSSASWTGGIAGKSGAIADDTDLFNYGDISGSGRVGGIFGESSGLIRARNRSCRIINEGDISGEDNVGGIAGIDSNQPIHAARNTLVENSGIITGKNNVGGIYGSVSSDFGGMEWVGATDGVYRNTGKIRGTENVGGLFGNWTKSFNTNIDLSALMENNVQGLAVGEAGISGVRNVGGLFGYAKGGIYNANLQLVNKSSVSAVDTDGENEGVGAGGIAGKTGGISSLSDGTIQNLGQISGKDAVGGIIGVAEGTVTLDKGTVQSEGKITAQKNAGGLFGEIKDDLVGTQDTNYIIKGDVSAGETAGGIVGRVFPVKEDSAVKISGMAVTDKNILGEITGNTAVGTIAGSANGAEFIACFSNLAPENAPTKGIFLGQAEEGSTVSIKGSYYIDEKEQASGFVGRDDGGNLELTEAYFLVPDEHEGTEQGAAKKADFALGEIAFKMAEAIEDSKVEVTWGQNMGIDDFPEFANDIHPSIYKISIKENTELQEVSVKFKKTPETGSWLSRGLYVYSNPGTTVSLEVYGVPEGKELNFLPLDTVNFSQGAYQITCPAKNMTISYDIDEIPEVDKTWYKPELDKFTLTAESELRGLAELVNIDGIDFSEKTIVLGADVTIKGKKWTGIGTDAHPFKGAFEAGAKTEGEYYKISRLHINTIQDKKGFFGCLSHATVRNLTVSGAVYGGNHIGSITAVAEDTLFENCRNEANLKGGTAGGIAGYAKGSAFTACENRVNVFETTGDTGGLVGYAENCTFKNCNNNIEFTSSDGSSFGGIAGHAKGSTFTECFNIGKVSGTNNVGGVAGISSEGTEFNNCGNKGTISGQSKVGGTAGTGAGNSFENCTNEGTIDGSDYIGGIVGYVESGNTVFKQCSNAKETGTVSATGNYSGGVVGYLMGAARLEECSNLGTVTGNQYTAGVAAYMSVGTEDADIRLIDCCNNGTVTGKSNYTAGVVADAGDYRERGYYNLQVCHNGKEGVITGGNYTGGVGGRLRNYVSVQDCYNDGEISGKQNTGGVAGNFSGETVSNCFNTGEVIGANYTGGVFGELSSCNKASNVYNEGQVTGSRQYTGGVIGRISSRVMGPVTYVYNKGIVHGTGQLTGGVFGSVAPGANDYISFCYNEGEVEGNGDYVGGVVGFFQGTYSYSEGFSISHLTNCWNMGTVTGTGSQTAVGGIAGLQSSYIKPINSLYCLAKNCFNYGAVNGVSADKTGAISAVGDENNENGFYLEGSVKVNGESITPVDLRYEKLAEKTEAEFKNGEIAYLLDNGGTTNRTMLWGQGSSYPVPADKDHRPIFKFKIELPEENNQGTITYGKGEEAVLEGYIPRDSETQFQVSPDEGYILDFVEVIGEDKTRYKAVLSEDAGSFTITMPASNITVTGAFTEQLTEEELLIEFTATFDANGGKWSDDETIKQIVVKNGSRLKAYEPLPVNEDDYGDSMEFTGWYRDAGCTEEYNFTALVKGDLTLYAGWHSESKHIVTFDANGGSFENSKDTLKVVVVDGDRVSEITSGFSNGDMIFLGWFTDKGCMTLYDFDKPVTGNMVLFAGWKNPGEVVVLFDSGEGVIISETGEETNMLRVVLKEGSNLTFPEESGYTVKREPRSSTLYELDGWLTEDGELWETDAIVEKDMTLTANWKETDLLGLGTEEDPVKIDGLEILEDLRDRVNEGKTYEECYFLLTTDIKLPADWESIGASSAFQGYFDGGRCTITLHDNQEKPVFGTVGKGAVIINWDIEGGTLTKMNTGPFIYTLEGGDSPKVNTGGKVKNITLKAKLYNCCSGLIYQTYQGVEIENVTIRSGSVISGYELVAGMVALGRSTYGIGDILFTDCVVQEGVLIEAKGPSGSGTAAGVAGIMAYGGGTFTRCMNGADIVADNRSGSTHVAGILASGNSMGVGKEGFYYCVNTGDFKISGGKSGGIAGMAFSRNFPIYYCYSTGDITSTGTTGEIGGLAGSPYTIVNSYYYGNITVPRGTLNVGGMTGSSNVPGGISMSYYGLKTDAPDITDPFDGKGVTQLPASAFESGEAAYLLDGGARRRELRWTQDEEDKYPIIGKPPYYRFQASTDGNGTLTLSTEQKEGTDIYIGEGSKVTVTAVPNPSWTEGNIKYSYELDSLEVNGKDFTNKGTFDFQEDSVAKATFKLVEEEIEPEPEPEPEPKPDDGGGDKGKGKDKDKSEDVTEDIPDIGPGEGEGSGGIGTGEGKGMGPGTDAGDQEGSQKGEGTSDKVASESGQKITTDSVPHESRTEIKKELPKASEEDVKEEMHPQEAEPEDDKDEDEEPEEPEKPEEESSTVFKILQDRIKENPVTVIAVVLGILLINALIAFIRFKKLKK